MTTAAFLALVIAVHDGDTLRVRTEAGITQAIRIAHIDAPELRQPWGRVSGRSLRTLCLGTYAWVQPTTTDRYRRTVAEVTCRAKDASHHQVDRGMAWVFQRYEPATSPHYATEAKAQHHHRGLWMDPQPIPPWQHRQTRTSVKLRATSTLVDK